MTRTLVRLMLPPDLDGYYIDVDPDHITGMHQMGNGREEHQGHRKPAGGLPEAVQKKRLSKSPGTRDKRKERNHRSMPFDYITGGNK